MLLLFWSCWTRKTQVTTPITTVSPLSGMWLPRWCFTSALGRINGACCQGNRLCQRSPSLFSMETAYFDNLKDCRKHGGSVEWLPNIIWHTRDLSKEQNEKTSGNMPVVICVFHTCSVTEISLFLSDVSANQGGRVHHFSGVFSDLWDVCIMFIMLVIRTFQLMLAKFNL